MDADTQKKLQDATPGPLPQTPVVKRPRTDAEEEFLKGRVKSVFETNEYLDGTGSVSGIHDSDEMHFDENGNLLKRVFFDYRGNPSNVTVFGFIDGKRVSKRGDEINYDYNPPLMVPPGGLGPPSASGTKKPADSRYSESVEYKYDSKGRLIERVTLGNRGEFDRKEVFTYDGSKVSELTTDEDGKVSFKILRVYDDKSNLIEQTYFSTNPGYRDDEKYTYTYLTFDSHGNWTKREERVKVAQYGGGTKDLHSFEYRTILYY